ncbi:MAG: site-2 protease family protein [Magnetococcales bacterium]|nr:site-2 protease family protein [Magnetococcales bacterium]MBF0156632.1 site-2 protease family protein [Magnetococcales bacterium]
MVTETVINLIIWAPAILFSITLHEWAHGYMAYRCGDHTPLMMGRLTLNPLPHIDLIWSIVLPVVMLVTSLSTIGQPLVFGGAKPVPINPRNFQGSLRSGLFWVAIAGPLMNFFLGFLCALALQGVAWLPAYFQVPLENMLVAGIQMNVVLAVFNLFPLPPLDGGRILTALLPPPLDGYVASLERYGFIILVALMFSGGLSPLIRPTMVFFLRFYYELGGL